jgi:prepilin-type N-terminal cleavage/methylation domain-containing protein
MRRLSGFTLVEMMVALVAGLIVSAAIIAFLLASMKSNGDYVQSTRLTQELRNTLDLATRDLSRAGYNDGALALDSLPVASPFAPVFVKDAAPAVTAGTPATYGNADTDGCVIYAYDRTYPTGYRDDGACDDVTGCGAAGAVDLGNHEVRGIRRTCIDGACDGVPDDVGVIEVAESVTGLEPACNGAPADYSSSPSTCNASSGWCGLSDPSQIDITRFMVINTSSDLSNLMRIRDFGLHLEGRLLRGDDPPRAVSTEVKIRADCINPDFLTCASAPGP